MSRNGTRVAKEVDIDEEGRDKGYFYMSRRYEEKRSNNGNKVESFGKV